MRLAFTLISDFLFQEHVIIQLQEETETVGEYITIYQYQRQQQRRRLEENERQLQIVSRDREDLKSKLSQLQSLVTSFVQDGGSSAKPKSGQKTLNGPSNHNGNLNTWISSNQLNVIVLGNIGYGRK